MSAVAKQTIQDALFDSIAHLIEGATKDVEAYLNAIANGVVQAAMVEDQEDRAKLLNEMYGQVKVIGELNRIRAVNESWKLVELATATVGNFIVAGLTNGLFSLSQSIKNT